MRTCALRLAALVCVLALGAGRCAYAQLRIVTYNTGTGQADNPTTGQTARAGISTLLQAIGAEVVGGIAKPIDVLILQEQYTMAKTTQSFVDVLNSIYGAGVYARSTLNGLTSDPQAEAGRPGLVYNTQTVKLLNMVDDGIQGETFFGNVGTSDGSGTAGNPAPAQQPRSTLRYQMRPVGYGAEADFYVYNSHYKSDTGSGNNNRRLAEAVSIRANSDALGADAHAIYAGDYNIQTHTAAMYLTLLGGGNGRAVDPIATPGSWHGDTADVDTPFKIVHTQAPATVAQYSGQTTGGMDDRFDFQLVTEELMDNEGMSYIPGSYHAFGNNGSHVCCNSPITTGTGAAPAVLTALMQSSDHLPVVADYMLPAKMGVQVTSFPSLVELGSVVPIDVTVTNLAPAMFTNGADELDYTLSVMGSLTGGVMGSDAALGAGNVHQVLLNTSTLGMKSGTIAVSAAASQNAANSAFSQNLMFQVIAGFLEADFNKDGQVNGVDLSTWSTNFGLASGAVKNQGDADLDGDVDGGDWLVWQRQRGSLPAGLVASALVPEPGAGVMALVGLAAWGRRGRRRRGPGMPCPAL